MNDKTQSKVLALSTLFPGLKSQDALSVVSILEVLSNERRINEICEKVRSKGSVPNEFIPYSIASAKRDWNKDRLRACRSERTPDQVQEDREKAATSMRRLRANRREAKPTLE